MKIQSKFVRIFAAMAVVILITGLFFFGRTVKGQSDRPDPLMKAETPSSHTPKIQNKVVEGVEFTSTLADANKEDYLPLEPVVLSLLLKNVSGKIVGFTETYSPRDYTIIVKDSDNNIMPFTRYGIANESGVGSASSAARKVSLAPGETKQFKIAVNRSIDMTVDNTYSIVIRRSISVDGNFGDVVSNEVQVNVTTKDSGVGDISLPGEKSSESLVQ